MTRRLFLGLFALIGAVPRIALEPAPQVDFYELGQQYAEAKWAKMIERGCLHGT